jgi:tryptophan synthase beta chain
MVARFQSVISAEVKEQLAGRGIEKPSHVIACVGGGSNSIGSFYHYLQDERVQLIGVEAAGKGLNSGLSAATLALGSDGVLHGSRTVVMQDGDGQIIEAHSISAGLDYPGIGPQHAHLSKVGRVKYVSITDQEALEGAVLLSRLEGIIPALESAHAVAHLLKLQLPKDNDVVVCISGRGDKDMQTYLSNTSLNNTEGL